MFPWYLLVYMIEEGVAQFGKVVWQKEFSLAATTNIANTIIFLFIVIVLFLAFW